jgi:hypothetical protein
MLVGHHYPHLTCPNCRATHDVEADIEDDDSDWGESDAADPELQHALAASKQLPLASKPPQVDRDGDSPMTDVPNGTSQRSPPSIPPVQQQSHGGLSFILGSTSVATPPRNIPARNGSGSRLELLQSTANGQEGPLTPRNDAGPFVLDGGAANGTTGASAQSDA